MKNSNHLNFMNNFDLNSKWICVRVFLNALINAEKLYCVFWFSCFDVRKKNSQQFTSVNRNKECNGGIGGDGKHYFHKCILWNFFLEKVCKNRGLYVKLYPWKVQLLWLSEEKSVHIKRLCMCLCNCDSIWVKIEKIEKGISRKTLFYEWYSFDRLAWVW